MLKFHRKVDVCYVIYSLRFFFCVFGLYHKKKNKNKLETRKAKRSEDGGRQSSVGLSGIGEKVKPKGRARRTSKVSRRRREASSCQLRCGGRKACLHPCTPAPREPARANPQRPRADLARPLVGAGRNAALARAPIHLSFSSSCFQ